MLMALLYVIATVSFDVLDSRHLVAEVDQSLTDTLRDVVEYGGAQPTAGSHLPEGRDLDEAPVVVWRVSPAGDAVALTESAPPLPAGSWSTPGRPTTAVLTTGQFRVMAGRADGTTLVVGQSLANIQRIEAVVDGAEVIVGPVLVLTMFLASLSIGMMASRPVEQARLRQLEFTADASHEIRTPLTVIEAEVGLALSAPRGAASYRGTLERVGAEGRRLRHIVEDLLFLARFDSAPPAPNDEPVDLATLAQSCAERFSAVALARDIDLSVTSEGPGPALVNAPPGWADRLCGVLVDNACRYAGAGGTVKVLVTTNGNVASLAVEDSGPGIPPEERPLLFDRFHRATDQGEGAGLGLAIADAVVRATGGRWLVSGAPAGGARMEVSWRLFQPRDTRSEQGLRPRRRRFGSSGRTAVPLGRPAQGLEGPAQGLEGSAQGLGEPGADAPH